MKQPTMKPRRTWISAFMGAALWVAACSDEDRSPQVAQVTQRAVGDPVEATVEEQDNWGNGYVANMIVCNNGTEPTTN